MAIMKHVGFCFGHFTSDAAKLMRIKLATGRLSGSMYGRKFVLTTSRGYSQEADWQRWKVLSLDDVFNNNNNTC